MVMIVLAKGGFNEWMGGKNWISQTSVVNDHYGSPQL
jgi:hypothetical protein